MLNVNLSGLFFTLVKNNSGNTIKHVLLYRCGWNLPHLLFPFFLFLLLLLRLTLILYSQFHRRTQTKALKYQINSDYARFIVAHSVHVYSVCMLSV